MIDRAVFASCMGMLAGNFRHNVDDAVIRMYFDMLTAELSQPEFELAVAEILKRDTFWPPVARIFEVANLDRQYKAMMALEHVRSVFAAAGGPQHLTTEQYRAELTPAMHRALWAAGGPAKLLDGKSNGYEAGNAARTFLEAFVAELREEARIAAASETPLVANAGHLRLAKGDT